MRPSPAACALLVLLAAGAGAGASSARTLLQRIAPAAEAGEYAAGVPAVLQVPYACRPKWTCPGVGPQIYTCNGTHWENTNSSVALKCNEGPVGVHSVIAKVPSYTFSTCGSGTGNGFMQGRTSDQVMVPTPTGNPKVDLPVYRRAAFNESGCVSGISYVTRTETQGGQPPTPTCSAAERGADEGIDYTAVFSFWVC